MRNIIGYSRSPTFLAKDFSLLKMILILVAKIRATICQNLLTINLVVI